MLINVLLKSILLPRLFNEIVQHCYARFILEVIVLILLTTVRMNSVGVFFALYVTTSGGWKIMYLNLHVHGALDVKIQHNF
jgi:hypothetical protein